MEVDLTVEELAAQVGVSCAAVVRWEAGYQVPYIRDLPNLAVALSKPLTFFIDQPLG